MEQMEKSNRFSAVSARRAASLAHRLVSGTSARWRQAKNSRPEYHFPEPPLDLGPVEVVYVDEPEVVYGGEETSQGDDGQTEESTEGQVLEAETPHLEPVEKGVKKLRTVKGTQHGKA